MTHIKQCLLRQNKTMKQFTKPTTCSLEGNVTFYCGINPELSAYDDSLPKMVCAYLSCRGSLSHQINTGLARRLTSQPTWATHHRARTTQLDCESVSSVYEILIKHISREQELLRQNKHHMNTCILGNETTK